MRPAHSDLIRLHRLERLLEEEFLSLESRTGELYEFLFENEDFHGRKFPTFDCSTWDDEALDRGLGYAAEIITRYARLFYDPSRLRVTYYKRQRRVASMLDQITSPILKERILRKGEEPPQDLFLNEPIFYLKKEARTKAYPKSKDGRLSLRVIQTRFQEKLFAKRVA